MQHTLCFLNPSGTSACYPPSISVAERLPQNVLKRSCRQQQQTFGVKLFPSITVRARPTARCHARQGDQSRGNQRFNTSFVLPHAVYGTTSHHEASATSLTESAVFSHDNNLPISLSLLSGEPSQIYCLQFAPLKKFSQSISVIWRRTTIVVPGSNGSSSKDSTNGVKEGPVITSLPPGPSNGSDSGDDGGGNIVPPLRPVSEGGDDSSDEAGDIAAIRGYLRRQIDSMKNKYQDTVTRYENLWSRSRLVINVFTVTQLVMVVVCSVAVAVYAWVSEVQVAWEERYRLAVRLSSDKRDILLQYARSKSKAAKDVEEVPEPDLEIVNLGNVIYLTRPKEAYQPDPFEDDVLEQHMKSLTPWVYSDPVQ